MWADDVVAAVVAAYRPLGDAARADGARRYLKQVAPFLGLVTSQRRKALRAAVSGLTAPNESELLAGVAALWALPEREYHYSAIELAGRYLPLLAPVRLDREVRELVATKSWWDTVDLAGTKVITPMVAAHPDLVAVMWRWNRSDSQWLVRASIQHQRGLKMRTDVPLVIAMCEPHAADRRFFVAKAIGWALRDLCVIDPDAVRAFVATHPDLPAVARREADRGLGRLVEVVNPPGPPEWSDPTATRATD